MRHCTTTIARLIRPERAEHMGPLDIPCMRHGANHFVVEYICPTYWTILDPLYDAPSSRGELKHIRKAIYTLSISHKRTPNTHPPQLQTDREARYTERWLDRRLVLRNRRHSHSCPSHAKQQETRPTPPQRYVGISKYDQFPRGPSPLAYPRHSPGLPLFPSAKAYEHHP